MSEENPEMLKALIPVAAAAATVALGVPAAGASEAGPPPPGATPPAAGDIDVQLPDSTERVETYWTRDRMRAAKPMPSPRISRETAKPAGEASEAEPE